MQINKEQFANHIKPLFNRSMYVSIATLGHDGKPHIAPIGSVKVLNEKQGFFLDKFSRQMTQNLEHNPVACLMVVNTGIGFWISSLIQGQFKKPPAVRLVVKFHPKRPTTEAEAKRFQRKVRFFKKTAGYRLLWKEMKFTREFEIIDILPVSLGRMTEELFR